MEKVLATAKLHSGGEFCRSEVVNGEVVLYAKFANVQPYELKGYSKIIMEDGRYYCTNITSNRKLVWISTYDLNYGFLDTWTTTMPEEWEGKARINEAMRNRPEAGGFWTLVNATNVALEDLNPRDRKTLDRLEEIATAVDPANGSKIATPHHWFLYLYRLLVDKEAKPYEVFVDSSEIGKYSESKNPRTKLGGILHAIGTTSKVFKDVLGNFWKGSGSEVNGGKHCQAGDVRLRKNSGDWDRVDPFVVI
ncbi:MAG: hypothetical protein FWC79_07495 [Oscillospiraceae bacterium]|nr:hypothetical protein [Oscillospiraceae bacterium]